MIEFLSPTLFRVTECLPMSTTTRRRPAADDTTRIEFEIRDDVAAERAQQIARRRAAHLDRQLALLPDGYPPGPREADGSTSL
jgi:hypothetical protein